MYMQLDIGYDNKEFVVVRTSKFSGLQTQNNVVAANRRVVRVWPGLRVPLIHSKHLDTLFMVSGTFEKLLS
jgi:hypothetical protein